MYMAGLTTALLIKEAQEMADTQSFDENAGTNKLANVLCDRMKREGETPLALDFGEIQANGSLTTNTCC